MSAKNKLPMLDRLRVMVGMEPRATASGFPAYQGASLSRLNADWIGSLLSSDQEIRGSLKRLRARCRQLHNNNDYAQRFVHLVKQNVVGQKGIALEASISNEADELSDQVNEELERCWNEWTRLGNVTCDGTMSFRDLLNLALETIIVDGEVFLRIVRGFPHNPYKFALQFIDPDQVDVGFNRVRHADPNGQVTNKVVMGVELDEWNRRMGYWIFKGHPAEGQVTRERVPASDMIHKFLPRRGSQTRGVPALVTAMSKMNMLGGYEEAELVAARMGACKMGFLTSKTGEEYTGKVNATTGAKEVTVTPGSIDQLPEGMDFKEWNPNHPNSGYGEFVKSMLRGMAVGLNVSYHSLAGDLREVNFSSIRQGALEERDAWRALQTFAIEHLCQPIFEAWIVQALATKQLKLPAAGLDTYTDPESVQWTARGWTWVDPLKDIEAAIAGRGAGMTTLQEIAAQQGKDWTDVIDQIAKEDEYAKARGVELNFARPKPTSIGTIPEETPGTPTKPAPANQPSDGGDNS